MKLKVIAIMGEAGSGKDTILHLLVSQFPNKFNEIISCTTRPPREGEQNGLNYRFLAKEEFMEKVSNGEMLEYTEFNNWLYGTALSSLSREKVNVGVFNPAGVRALAKNPQIELNTFYVRAPAKERLLRQLNRERDPDVTEIVRRFAADEKDFASLNDICYHNLANETPLDIYNALAAINSFC